MGEPQNHRGLFSKNRSTNPSPDLENLCLGGGSGNRDVENYPGDSDGPHKFPLLIWSTDIYLGPPVAQHSKV